MEVFLQVFVGSCHELPVLAGFCYKPLELFHVDLQGFVMLTKEDKTDTGSSERISEKPAKKSQSTKKSAGNLQEISKKPRTDRQRIMVSDDVSVHRRIRRGAIKNPSTDGFNSVKLSFPQILLCCEEGSDVILVDDLLQCLDSGAVSDNAHDAVLCYLAHGSDLCCHAACAEP